MKKNKPLCPLIDADGNIYNLVYITKRVLKEHSRQKEADEMWKRVQKSGSYHEAFRCYV